MVKRKQRPQRTCLVCRQNRPKHELDRIVRTPDGAILVDPFGKVNGRGAYLCRQGRCRAKGLQPQRLGQALKAQVTLETITTLQEQLGQIGDS